MKYHLVALLTVVIWGATIVSTKVLLPIFSPLQILAIRFVIGFAALCIARPHILKVKDKKDELLFAATGFAGIFAYYLLENIALEYTTATAVAVILAAAPLFATLIAACMGDRSTLTVRFFAGLACALVGIGMVGIATEVEDPAILGGFSLWGDTLALAAAFVWVIYSMAVKRLGQRGYDAFEITKRSFFWGLVFIIPACAIMGGPLPAAEDALSAISVGNLISLGLVNSALCFALWNYALKHLGPVITTTYLYLVPGIGAIASIWLLGEPLDMGIVAGVLLTILGLAISQDWSEMHKKQES